MGDTAIGWTDKSWNPVTGCSKVSDGCAHCYAELLSLRHGWSKKPWSNQNAGENVLLHPDRLREPYSWKKPVMVFACSMGDLFHDLVPDAFLSQIFTVMNDLPRHIFQILTKRPARAAHWPGPWTPNIWMGTSVEDSRVTHRIDILRHCPAHVKFISFEPLIGPVGEVDLSGYQWAIVGGESGPNFRQMDMAWARAIRDRCADQAVALFFKQDSSLAAGTRPYLVEVDGAKVEYKQYPGERATMPTGTVGRCRDRRPDPALL